MESKEDARGIRRYINLNAKEFPLELFEEWNEDCSKNFGDLRWTKIWHDHKMCRLVESMSLRLDDIEKRLGSIESRGEPKAKRMTLGSD